MNLPSFSTLLKAAWPTLIYMLYASAYTGVQHYGLFERYKIARSNPTTENVTDAFIRCLMLLCMHALIEYFFGDEHMYSPGESIRLIHFVLGMVAVDTYQYFFHRFVLHAVPFLYRNMHRPHHKFAEPFAFSGLYNSFSEAILADAGCIIFATLICRLTAAESVLLAAVASAKTVQSHSGYMLPFDPFTYFANNAIYHRYHHQSPYVYNSAAFQQPFFTFWDVWLGTHPSTKSGTTTSRPPRNEHNNHKAKTAGTATTSAQWNNFARIACVNLRERPDRLEHAKRELCKAGILERVEFCIEDKSPHGGCYGCFASHWKIIKQAHEDGLANVLIFEDDLVFQELHWEQVVNDCNAFVKEEPDDWEFLNLNGFIMYCVEDSRSSSRIINGKSAKSHAICLSRKGMTRFLKRFPTPTAVGVDDAYMACLSRTYVHRNYHAIVQLEDLGTDNPWCFFDVVKGMDADYQAFIQNVYMPAISRTLSSVNLVLFALPWHVRPWLLSQGFSENLSTNIQIYRNGHEEEIPWRVSLLGNIMVTVLGFYVALFLPLPTGINRIKMIWFLLQI